MTTLGLLETDTLYDDLIPDYGSYGQMFAAFFNHLDSDLQYRYYQVKEGELPRETNECDAYLITGSKAGVYDSDPWISRLQSWIADFHQQSAKLIGICFGHQMIAHSLGGLAAKSNRGWGVGVHTTVVPGKEKSLRLLYSHQDQVKELPPEAKVLSASDFCPYAAFKIDNRVLSFQGHPEFTPQYLQRLLHRRIEAIGEERFAQAMDSLREKTDELEVGRQLLAFIRGGI